VAAWTNATPAHATGADPLDSGGRVRDPERPRPSRTSTDAGVLRTADGSGISPVYRPPAGPAVTDVVERYWSVCWSTEQSVRREVITHPAFHLTVTTVVDESGPALRAEVNGVMTRTFAVDLHGRGGVVGAKFRPGGFAALTGRSASAFTDRQVPLADVLPAAAVDRLLRRVAASPEDPDVAVAALEELISGLVPPRLPPAYPVVLAVVADMLADHSLSRVEDVAARHDLSVRGLQRLFRRFVGVGPKWVLQRYRLHDAVTAIDSDPGVMADLAGLAASLGWWDQSHFTRDFTAAVGVSPHAYAARPV
jgi:AraC-like DNA-binding protein